MIRDKSKRNNIISVKSGCSTLAKVVQMRKFARTVTTITSNATSANTNVQPQVQISKSASLPYIPPRKQDSSEQEKKTVRKAGRLYYRLK